MIHVYAKDLDDRRELVNERDEGSAVHICVDAQTGLGSEPPRASQALFARTLDGKRLSLTAQKKGDCWKNSFWKTR